MTGFDSPLLVALAIDDPDREGQLLRVLHDPQFRAGSRACEVGRLCASVQDLEGTIANGEVEVAVVASQLGAIPFPSLVSLAQRRVRVVVCAADATDSRWDDFPGGLVIGQQPSAEMLGAALAGDRVAVAAWRGRGASEPPRSVSRTPRAAPDKAAKQSEPKPDKRGTVIALAGAYEPSGRSVLAAGLARALGARGRTVLVDADVRMGTTPFTLGVSAGHSVCQLAEKHLSNSSAWDLALDSELQSLGDTSHLAVLAGVPRPSMRTRLSATFYQRLVHVLAERFAYVVLDTGGSGWSVADSPIDGLSLQLADHILLAIRPDLQGVALAREALHEWSGGRDKISLVLNQTGNRGLHGESRAEIEVVLGLGVAAVVPFDPQGVSSATSRQRPIVCQRDARAAPPLLDLAGRLTGGGPVLLAPDVEPLNTTAWWQRLTPTGVGGLLRW
jgi:Flp pilus assembly CpaE family ATPase